MITVMLTGKNGQLGWELQRSLSTIGNLIAFSHSELDLSDEKILREKIADIKPDLIVNAAAYTAVDQAEQEESLATAINATAPAIMAEEAKKLGAMMIHYSTDYVFDGESESPYSEDDPTGPINVYGKSKLQGEQAIQSQDIPYFIFRTSWVYANRGNNFLLTMLRLMQERESLNVIDDQFGAPTWSRMIAEMTGQILAKTNGCQTFNPDAFKAASGIYHLSNKGHTSWNGFANKILEKSKTALEISPTFQLSAIPTSEYPTPAARPKFSKLSLDKIEQQFGVSVPDWQDSLSLCLQDRFG